MVAESRWPRVQPEAAAGLVVELGGGPGSARPGLCPHGVVASCGPSPCTPSPWNPSPCTPNSLHPISTSEEEAGLQGRVSEVSV